MEAPDINQNLGGHPNGLEGLPNPILAGGQAGNNVPNGGVNHVPFQANVTLPQQANPGNQQHQQDDEQFEEAEWQIANDFIVNKQDYLASWNSSADPNKGKIKPIQPERFEKGMLMVVIKFLLNAAFTYENAVKSHQLIYGNISNDTASQHAMLTRVFIAGQGPVPTAPQVVKFRSRSTT